MKIFKVIDSEVRVVNPEADNYAKTYHNEGVILDIYKSTTNEINFKKWRYQSLFDEMHLAGIEKAIVSGLAWQDPKLQEINNEYVDQTISKSKGQLKGFFIPPINLPIEKVLKIIENLDWSKYIGIELIPKWQKIDLDLEKYIPLFKLLESINKYIKVYTCHLTQSFFGNTPQQTFKLIKKYPNNKFVIPHLGGLLPIYALDERYKKIINNTIFLGSTSSTMIMNKLCLEVFGDNILFASDFPFNHCFSIKEALSISKSMGLENNLLEKFLYNNAVKFFGD